MDDKRQRKEGKGGEKNVVRVHGFRNKDQTEKPFAVIAQNGFEPKRFFSTQIFNNNRCFLKSVVPFLVESQRLLVFHCALDLKYVCMGVRNSVDKVRRVESFIFFWQLLVKRG